jgi:hypothetical protein
MEKPLSIDEDERKFLLYELKLLEDYYKFADEFERTTTKKDRNAIYRVGEKTKEVIINLLNPEYKGQKGIEICGRLIKKLESDTNG